MRHFAVIAIILFALLSACGKQEGNRPRPRAAYYDPCYADYYCYGHGWTDYEY